MLIIAKFTLGAYFSGEFVKYTEKIALVKFDQKLVKKKRQPNRQVNVTRFASKRYCKQYSVTVTFSIPVSVY